MTFWYVPETGTIEPKRHVRYDGEYEPYTDDWVPYNYPSDEATKALYDEAASILVKQWQITSNDSNVMSLRVQDVAREIFELNDSLGWRLGPRQTNRESAVLSPEEHVPLPISPAQKKLLTVFLKAQYSQTQEYLKKKGITKMAVYRGYGSDELRSELGDSDREIVDTLELRPLSSFSVDPKIASGFGLVVMESVVNAEDIIALPLTGSGCLGESEAIVLGRSGLSGTIRGREAFNRRIDKMKAAKRKEEEEMYEIPPPPDWNSDF